MYPTNLRPEILMNMDRNSSSLPIDINEHGHEKFHGARAHIFISFTPIWTVFIKTTLICSTGGIIHKHNGFISIKMSVIRTELTKQMRRHYSVPNDYLVKYISTSWSILNSASQQFVVQEHCSKEVNSMGWLAFDSQTSEAFFKAVLRLFISLIF